MADTPRSSAFRAFDLLSPLGLIIIVAAAGWQRLSTKALPGQPRWYYAAGVALILAHLVLRWDDVTGAIGRRQMRYGANTAVLIAAVLAVLGGLNYLAARRDKSWDLTKNQRHSLTDETRRVLQGLGQDVTLTYFERGDRMAEGRSRLEQYGAASRRLKVVFVDPVVDPVPAQQYEVTSVPTIVVEKGDRREKISNDSEQDITNAIIKVTRGAQKTVCFAQGEGERDVDDGSRNGLSSVKAALEKTQYATRKVVLARERVVPAECTVLVVAGAQNDLFPPALEAVRRFVKSGGKAMLLLEPELAGSTSAGLAALAADWNLQVGNDVVVDTSGMGQMVGGGPFTPVVMDYPYHDITKDLRGMSAFHIARTVQAGTGGATGIAAQNLVQTLDVSWAETDLALKTVGYDEGRDRRGPVSLAAVATLSGAALDPVGAAPAPLPTAAPAESLEAPAIASPVAPPPPSPSPSGSTSPGASPSSSPAAGASPAPAATPDPSRREARVAVFGDADFATNALQRVPGNEELFVNTVAWLAQDPDLISIRPREPEDQKLFLTQQQQGNVRLLSLVLLPGALLALGVASWWRRRG